MKFDKMDAYTVEMQERWNLPAYDIAVSVDGEEVYRKIGGYADSAKTKPVSREDCYLCYSASKVLTGASLAQLITEGRISLDDEAAKYVPAFAAAKVRVCDENGRIVAVRAPKTPILIRHLATMTAGMTYNYGHRAVLEAAQANPQMTAQEAIAPFMDEPLLFDPGESYNYSLCLDALGGVIEAVTGMRLSEYVAETFCEPLGMHDLTYHPTPETDARMSALYCARGKDAQGKTLYEEVTPIRSGFHDFPGFDSGGGGVISTVDDYMKFASALACGGVGANGRRVMSMEAIDLMRTPMLTPPQKQAYDRLGKLGTSYGLGVRTTVEPEKFHFCTPVGEFGWDGAAAAYVSICPERRVALYFGTHILDFGDGFNFIHHKLRELVYEIVE